MAQIPAQWFDILNAASTIVLAILTFVYVRLTHNLLKIQVEPRVRFFINGETADLVLENCGAYPVWNIEIAYDIRVLPGPVEHYGQNGILRSVEKLRPGKIHKASIGSVGASAVEQLKKAQQRLITGETAAQAFVRISLSWQRDFDYRVFNAVQLFEILESAVQSKPIFRVLATKDPVLDDLRDPLHHEENRAHMYT